MVEVSGHRDKDDLCATVDCPGLAGQTTLQPEQGFSTNSPGINPMTQHHPAPYRYFTGQLLSTNV
ncbi:MAG: hypothetical protein ACLFVP_09060 [Candidatus Bathyarchaeia archaeon]